MPTWTLDRLNAMPAPDFGAALGSVFEHASWVAEQAAAARPFATVTALHEAMREAVAHAGTERQLALIRGHPELGSRVRRAEFTTHSQAEQGALGLDRLSEAEFARFQQLNAAYRDKFSLPFVICVRRHTRQSILREMERRLGNDAAAEPATALAEIALIARLRLVGLVDGPGKPKTDGRLSTHVLDIVRGRPAAGVRVSLFEIGESARASLREAVTDADGRAELIAGEPLRIGSYELAFAIGDHFARLAQAAPGARHFRDLPFLDIVPLRVSIAEPEAHYHVPLLATPWSYTTYRGS
jgi:2-oxo-4-hydroxy-4-carboxy-5-ureidoimidazoline decarboxylase